MLSNVKDSLGSHSGSDLEGDSISLWVLMVSNSSSVNVPGLAETIVAVIESGVSIVSVRPSNDIKAFLGIVSQVSS